MQGKISRCFLLLSLLTLTLVGCQDSRKTFAGFTYGGGGNTFSCEPAVLTSGDNSFELRAGLPQDATSLLLTGTTALNPQHPNELSSAAVAVVGHSGVATLVSGNLVPQAEDGAVAHGSFDLVVKNPDGREFKVVGSYTASRESQPSL